MTTGEPGQRCTTPPGALHSGPPPSTGAQAGLLGCASDGDPDHPAQGPSLGAQCEAEGAQRGGGVRTLPRDSLQLAQGPAGQPPPQGEGSPVWT